MKIIIFSSGIPSERYKLIGIFGWDQAKALAKEGHEVIFAVIDMRSIRRFRKLGFERYEKEGIEIRALNLPIGAIPPYMFQFFSTWAAEKLYQRISNEFGCPDIIHAHFTTVIYSVAKIKDKYGFLLVGTEHSSKINKEYIQPTDYAIAKYAYGKVNQLVSVSKSLQKHIQNKFHLQSQYIPNIVDTTIFNIATSVDEFKSFTFVSIGNLTTNKNMEMIIKSFHMAFKNNKEPQLMIFGAGPEKIKLKKLIGELELTAQIHLLGEKTREEIAQTLKKSQAFVLGSKSETFGVVCIEALASGLPVIATKCGGVESFLDESNGILVEVNDIVSFAHAMSDLYYNKINFNKLSISQNIQTKYSASEISRQLIALYTEVMKENANATN